MPARPVAFITGSGKKRIGNVIAREAGWRGYDVAIHYNTSALDAEETKAEIEKYGVRALTYQADLSDPKAAVRLCENVLEDFGRVDLLVPCASVWPRIKLEETTIDDLYENFEVNTLAPFLCCQKIGAQMVTQEEGGVIITIGDWAVVRPYDDYAAYFVSKGAIETMTRVFANELSRKNPNVRVNCIHPGPAMVPDSVSDENKMKIVNHSLVGRLGEPENIAAAVFSLVDNSYITGVSIAVDGGRSVSNR